mgnify:CR=1 FL=1
MGEILQHAMVTLVAAGAAWVVIRRVFVTVSPGGGSKCASCPSARPSRQALDAVAKPLTLIR